MSARVRQGTRIKMILRINKDFFIMLVSSIATYFG